MKIIKIDKQPTVAEHIRMMDPFENPVMRFHLKHIKSVREAAGRTMKFEKPEYKYETNINAIDNGGYIEVLVSVKEKGKSLNRGKNEISI